MRVRVVKKINKQKITKKKLDVVSRTFILDAISISFKISNLECEKKNEQNKMAESSHPQY